MPRLQTTVGQLMVNSALPRDMRDYSRTLDKKGLSTLLRELALKHPERYREVSQQLSTIGWQAAYTTGGQSFGLRHLQASRVGQETRAVLRESLDQLYDDDSLSEDERDKKILLLVGKIAETQEGAIYDEQAAAGNPLASQVQSGSRGNKMNLASLLGSDLLYTDHHGRVIPFPVLKSYSQGLTPAEYWAGAYGARKGVIDLKMATQDAGFLSKQLNQIVHRGLVTAMDMAEDNDEDGQNPKSRGIRGLPVDTDDADNEGALLAQGVGGYRRNQTLNPKILEDLLQRGFKRILVRSPAVGGPADGGVYARDVGIREFGKLPVQGENVSLAAVQALSEPLTQAQISSKHSGGVSTASAAKAIGGFDHINQLIQVPKVFKGGAAHSEHDGTVQQIEEAPAGGYHVTIAGEKHYVGSGFDLKVKRGDTVEAGDVISEGTPNPATIVKYKGIGEGRRYFVKAFRAAFNDAGLTVHRRNVELLARGLINHVRLTDEFADHNPDDVVPYARLEHNYQPRPNSRQLAPSAAIGQHLERPVLHYTIGTRIRPSIVKEMDEFGIKRVDVHSEAPPFEAEMIRGMANLQHDPDWVTRMYGSGLQKGLFNATHRGGISDPTGTSFVPGLAQSTDFGRIGKVTTPKRASLAMLRAIIKEGKTPKQAKLFELCERVRETREKRAASTNTALQALQGPPATPPAMPSPSEIVNVTPTSAPQPAASRITPPAPKPPAPPAGASAATTGKFTPGQGLMPLYNMAPQQVGQFIQSTGPLAPLGMAALADMNAFKTLTTRPGQQTLQQTPAVAQGTPPPTPRPAPRPTPPPAPRPTAQPTPPPTPPASPTSDTLAMPTPGTPSLRLASTPDMMGD